MAISINPFDADSAIAACARGDRSALKLLYDAEAAKMLGVSLRILKRRALAEEAVQDAFMQVWRKADTFNPALGNGRTWLYAILRNRSLNILRNESRTDLTDNMDTFDGASEEDDPETITARLSDASALKRCLETLDPKRRAAVLLAFAHGLSHGELAERMKMPLGTVKSWIRRSLGSLKECLG